MRRLITRLILVLVSVSVVGYVCLYLHQDQQIWGLAKPFLPGALTDAPLVFTVNGLSAVGSAIPMNLTTVQVHVNTTDVASAPDTTAKAVVCPETNLTFVSAFFDFGNHPKGGGRRNVEDYYPWSNVFGRIYTHLIFYTDSAKFGEHIQTLRAHMASHLTTVIQVNRSSLWPFHPNNTGAIAALYARKGYPKHAPNTVVPEYSCSMHAKYACLHDALVSRLGLVATDLVAWVDIGYYRDKTNPNISYCVTSPKNFDRTKVLFNQVYTPNFNFSPKDVFYGNHVWVGGGMFIATREVMVKFCDEYKRATTFFLFKRDLSSTDQQTLYASMTSEGKKDVNLTVDIAVVPGNHWWFDLGNSVLTAVQ